MKAKAIPTALIAPCGMTCRLCLAYQRLKQLDQRYRARYGMSMIENLQTIERLGVRAFIKHQKERWTCPGCGDLLCVHRPVCLSCGRTRG